MTGCENLEKGRKQEGRHESKCLEINVRSGILGRYRSCDCACPDGGKKDVLKSRWWKKNPPESRLCG